MYVYWGGTGELFLRGPFRGGALHEAKITRKPLPLFFLFLVLLPLFVGHS